MSNLIINEIMPAPTSPEPEWIELYNYGKENINLDTLLVSDPSKTSKIYNFSIKSQQYCIICSDTNKLKSSRFIPNDATMYQISLPTFNNTTDYCEISTTLELIDSLYYDLQWGIIGKSLERVSPELPIINGENLTTSLDSTGATAGRKNSTKEVQSNDKTFFNINEIMFDVSSGYAEYIEIYNHSSDTSNLKFCKIADATGKGFIINDDIYVMPKDYFVLFWDTLIFNKFPKLKDSANYYYSKEKISLNNDDDIITIKNYKDSLIDSVNYSYKWHNPSLDYTKDVSLEKISENLESSLSTSWNSSTNIIGGTPGEKNSYEKNNDITNDINISPNPFSISKSGDMIKVEYRTPFSSSKLNIRIFDTSGYLVSHPINNQFSGQSGTLELGLIDRQNIKLTPQPYILLLEATDTSSGSIYETKNLFVITN